MMTSPEQNPAFMQGQAAQPVPSFEHNLNGAQSETGFAIVAGDLARVFGQKVAVNHLNLRVRRGEFFGFLGPNGAGKSTRIKMMVGQLRPTSGSGWVAGVDVWRDPLQARAAMGVLPEYLNLYERLSGREFLTFAGHMYGSP